MSRIVTIAVRHWKPIVALNAIFLAIAATFMALTPRVWTADAELVLPNSEGQLKASLGKLGDLEAGDAIFTQQVNPLNVLGSVLLSDATLRQVWQTDPEKDQFVSFERYRKLFEVKPEPESTVLSLKIDASSPELAKQRADKLLQTFQKRLTELRESDATQREQFMKKELETARSRLTRSQNSLSRFQKLSGLVNAPEQTKETVAAIGRLTTTQAEILSQHRASQTQVKTLSARLGLTPAEAMRSLRLGENANYKYVREKLAELDAKLAESRATFTDKTPQVQALVDERADLLAQMNRFIGEASGSPTTSATTDGSSSSSSSGINTTVGQDSAALIQQLLLAEGNADAQRQQADQLQQKIEQMGLELRSLPAAQARLVELQRQYDIAEGLYNGLIAKVQESRLNAFGGYPSIQILDQPHVDEKPSAPKTLPVLVGVILASIFGSIALALLMESRNPLLSPTDLENSGIPVLATVPMLKRSGLDIRTDLGTTTIEFQRLASAVSMMQLDNRRLMISSATQNEGKTTVTLGLAMALTTLGFRVLLVDGDYRKATLSQRLGYADPDMTLGCDPVSVRPGLDLLPTVRRQDEVIEYVAQGGLERSLNVMQVEGNYDYVLIDSPPVCQTCEAALMGAVAHHVVLVARPGVSERYLVQKTLDQFARHRVHLMGLVINGTEALTSPYLYKPAEVKVMQGVKPLRDSAQK
jgi:polysaccharide biosynthesis transport protein